MPLHLFSANSIQKKSIFEKISLTKEVKTDPVIIKIEPVSKKEVEEDSLF
jgi:hypothetical protein